MFEPSQKTNQSAEDTIYYAIAYYRLSREDRDKSNVRVSDSIENQRKIIQHYIQQHPDIILLEEAIDDGYTGTNYDRPGFKRVLQAIEEKRVNMVIVKDLSRLGREYIQTGAMIEMQFPQQHIRFVAINDQVDTSNHKESDDLLIPIKNLMNENYCREVSLKLRRQFRIQRQNGEFINNFTVFGYKRDPENKHHIVIDEPAAEVVRYIFSLAMQGFSPLQISKNLDAHGVMTPYEYKRLQTNYRSGFKKKSESKWSPQSIRDILNNTTYLGELCQGKSTTPSFKVKIKKELERSEWIIVEDAHDAIIDKAIFDAVQRQMKREIRLSPTENIVQPLAGYVFCGDCGRSMYRRIVKRGKKTFGYYGCSGYKDKACKLHNMSQTELEKVVLNAIRLQLDMFVDIDRLSQTVNKTDMIGKRTRMIDRQIEQKKQEMQTCISSTMKLYDSMTENVISQEEFSVLKKKYMSRTKELESVIQNLEKEKEELLNDKVDSLSWLRTLLKYREVDNLTHEIVVLMIDHVRVFEEKRVEIEFAFADELKEAEALVREIAKKEAI